MKEATGEATNTVVVIVLVGLVLSLGYVIINGLMGRIKNKTEDIDADYAISEVSNYEYL